MPTSVSLRKTLRTIPIFQSLPNEEMGAVVVRLTRKEYKPGEIVWSAGTRLDFIAIVQAGELLIEGRTCRLIKRANKLVAGDCVQPHDLMTGDAGPSMSARALTDLRLYLLQLQHLAALRSTCPTLDTVLVSRQETRARSLIASRLWNLLLIVLILLLIGRDTRVALSDTVCLASAQFLRSSNYSVALSLLKYALRLNPEGPLVHNQEGFALFEMGHVQPAAAAFEQALDRDEGCGVALSNLAFVNFSAGLAQQAIILQSQAAWIDFNTATVQYNLGMMLMEEQGHTLAIRALNEASRIDPDWALPRTQVSLAYLQEGDYVRAENAARAAIALDPDQYPPHLSLAIALYQQGKYGEALESTARALQINPDDIVTRFYQALLLRELGYPEETLLIFRRLLASCKSPLQCSRITAEIESMLR